MNQALLQNPHEQPLKIVLTSRAPFLGGAEVALGRMAKGLTDAGHEVITILGETGIVHDFLRDQGLSCEICPLPQTDRKKFLQYRSAKNQLRTLIRDIGPDLVHSNDLPTQQITGHALKGLKIPSLVYHRFTYDLQTIRWFLKYGVDRHCFVSQGLLDTMQEGWVELEEQGYAIVHDGLELPIWTTDAQAREDERQAAKQELGLNADRPVLLYFGQIIERKGVSDLLDAWARLEQSWRDEVQLLVVGDDLAGAGAYLAKMKEKATHLGLSVLFPGFQKNINTWISASDLLILPSHFDPLGNAMLESMSLGRCILSCAVGGIPEMIIDGETGVLVEARSPDSLARAMMELMHDSETRRSYESAARRRAESHFSLEAHLRNLIEQYRIVLDNYSGD